MEVVPALHIRDGRLVQGPVDKPSPAPTPHPDGGDDLAGLARSLNARFGSVAIVDHGSGRTDDAHHSLYQKLSKQHVALWVDAAPRTMEDVMDLFVSGATRVTLRTDSIDRDELNDILDIAEGEVWLGYPFRTDGELSSQVRYVEPLRYVDAGAAGVVLIDLAQTGTGQGFDPRHMDRIHGDVPVAVAGGIGRPTDLDALAQKGAAAALVGDALLRDIGAFKAAAERHNTGESPPPPTSDVEFTAPSRSFLPGVLPSRPRLPRVVPSDEENP